MIVASLHPYIHGIFLFTCYYIKQFQGLRIFWQGQSESESACTSMLHTCHNSKGLIMLLRQRRSLMVASDTILYACFNVCPSVMGVRRKSFDLAQNAALYLQSATYMTLTVYCCVYSVSYYWCAWTQQQGELALGRGRYWHVLGCSYIESKIESGSAVVYSCSTEGDN